jgi:3-keto-5-aminohexanoate cleavage enzyme
MTKKNTWLEVALNGPWSRDMQPLMPISPAEIIAQGIACANEGATIIHVHPYDVATGRQKDDPDIYARIIEGIREKVDVIVYPTLPFVGSVDVPTVCTPQERFAAVEELSRRGLLEWSVVDPGSCNFALFSDVEKDKMGFVYPNPETHLRHGLALAQRYGFVPSYAIYEPGFIRLGAALARRYPGARQAVYRLMFSHQYTFGYPPEPYAVDSYRHLLEQVVPDAPWMVSGLGVDLRKITPYVIAAGGHIRVGLEDAPFGTDRTNLEWVKDVVDAVHSAGGSLATVKEVRASLPVQT